MSIENNINHVDTLAIFRMAGGYTIQRDIDSIEYNVDEVDYIFKTLIKNRLIKIENFSDSENKKIINTFLPSKVSKK